MKLGLRILNIIKAILVVAVLVWFTQLDAGDYAALFVMTIIEAILAIFTVALVDYDIIIVLVPVFTVAMVIPELLFFKGSAGAPFAGFIGLHFLESFFAYNAWRKQAAEAKSKAASAKAEAAKNSAVKEQPQEEIETSAEAEPAS